MEKIKQLMSEAGISTKFANRICEALEAYRGDVRATEESKYAEKVTRAKEICEAEVEEHKRTLEKRLQIYCEAKSAEIDRIAAKQAQARETEATTKLESISDLLEGVTNGQPNGNLEAQITKLRAINVKLSEGKKSAITKAKTSVQLAEKVLKRNRVLERTVKESTAKTTGTTGTKVVKEGAKSGKKAAPKRIDEGRQGSKPKTTRRTLRESQEKRPRQQQAATEMRAPGAYSPSDIAHNMDE